MFKSIILATTVLFGLATTLQAQCGSSGCGFGGGGYVSGGCGGCGVSSGCNSGGCQTGNCVIVDSTALNIRLLDIPGGYEKTRYYVSVFFEEDNHTEKVPVINGYIPSAKLYRNSYGRVNQIVYSYANMVKYDNSFGNSDGYIHYTYAKYDDVSPVTTTKNNGKPSAVKNYDGVKSTVKETDRPSAVKFDFETKSEKTNSKLGGGRVGGVKVPDGEPFAKVKSIGPRSVDEEIEGLFNRPSSIKDSNENTPNYDR